MSSSCSQVFVPRQILDMKGVCSRVDVVQIAVVIRWIIFFDIFTMFLGRSWVGLFVPRKTSQNFAIFFSFRKTIE